MRFPDPGCKGPVIRAVYTHTGNDLLLADFPLMIH